MRTLGGRDLAAYHQERHQRTPSGWHDPSVQGAKLLGVRPIAESYGELRGELRGLPTGIRSSLDSEAQHKGDFKFAGERAEDNSEPIDLPASWRIGKTIIN
jgi:hypothetical protein